MKYMGSKRVMLKNDLGDLIVKEAKKAGRIVDLFCGAGFVAWYAAQNTEKPVVAVDLQEYAVVLAKAVIGRTKTLDHTEISDKWLRVVSEKRVRSARWKEAISIKRRKKLTKKYVEESRPLCEKPSSVGPLFNAYGGYYYSPKQALTLDYMLKYLPERENERAVCLAATIITASKCAAAPGHTAQPFRPTKKGRVYIQAAWDKDPVVEAESVLRDLCGRHACVPGEVHVADAVEFADQLKPDDLVFVDPPYSGVHYSRFYHVLETIARGERVSVEGAGRYPPFNERPNSDFSKRGTSREGLHKLLMGLAKARATVIFTFPAGKCSNGLSGDAIYGKARRYFDVTKKTINGRFSTLGGNNDHRAARQQSKELLLLLKPK